MTVNYLSFDIEDWFQVPFASADVPRASWDSLPSVVVGGTAVILDILKQYDTRATFFVVGWIAERYPDLVRRIADEGHEIGAHSYAHGLLDRMTRDELESDTARCVEAIYRACNIMPRDYRAPLASIGDRNPWAIDVLRDHAFLYDSSMFPRVGGVYGGMSSIGSAPQEIRPGFWEVPLSVQRKVPISASGYLRLLPFRLYRALLAERNRRGESFVLYAHPWEFDTNYPRPIRNLPKRFIQYYNLNSVASKLDKLLATFRFRPVIEALPQQLWKP